MIYKCKNCGSAIEYSPEKNMMVCRYCDATYTVEEVSQGGFTKNEEEADSKKAEYFEFNKPTDYSVDSTGVKKIIHENRFDFVNPSGFASNEVGDYKTILERKEEEQAKEEVRLHASVKMQIMRCTSCGAELAVNGVESSTFCAYCGQATVVADRVEDYLEPDYIIPFKVNKEDAERIIRAHLNEGFFIPKKIKNFETEKLRGIYVPFWLFDMYYHDKQFYKYKKKQGKTTVTRYEYFEGDTNYRRLTLDASSNLNDDSSTRLEPYDMRQLKEFDMAYLSGYYSDRFDVGVADITPAAVMKAMKLFDSEVQKELYHKNGKLVSRDPDFTVNKTEYALLPAWFLTVKNDGKSYTFLVNGQTGKMVGAVPFDKVKVTIFFALIALALSSVGILFITALSHFFFLQFGLQNRVTIMFAIGCPCVAFWLFTRAKKMYFSLKKSMSLTTATQINRFAKERQDA